MKRKLIGLLVAISTSALMLSACGNTSTKAPSSVSADNSVTDTSADAKETEKEDRI